MFCMSYLGIQEKRMGIRHGEKLHEIWINQDEIRYSWELRQLHH
jgi:FlaA1/EpsC-like NDP-sugar epimerase